MEVLLGWEDYRLVQSQKVGSVLFQLPIKLVLKRKLCQGDAYTGSMGKRDDFTLRVAWLNAVFVSQIIRVLTACSKCRAHELNGGNNT